MFHNEAWSTLLRTVHSVLNRSPHHLLAEIILVDDASERLFLGIALEQYMARLQRETRIPIQILRSLKRVGLIQARLLGTRHATASVLTYLDAHVEATTGWLPPLLHRLHERPDVVISPIIDVIHEQTFAYARSVDLHWGGVNWAMHFRWFAIGSRQIERNRYINQLYLARHSQASMTQTNQSDRLFEDWLDELEQSNRSSTSSADVSTPIDLADGLVRPFKSPVMAGGLFSIRRDFFQRLGTYDPWMKVWGGENIELSLRVWSCGGRVETHPCSHVAHVFRRSSPYAFPGGVSHVLYTNLARVLHVWMEPRYQLFFYLLNEPLRNFMLDSEPDIDVIRLLQHEAFDRLLAVFSNQTRIESKLPALNQRVRLKTEHRCNGFEWFLRHVWPQSFFPLSDRFFGQLKVKANNRCAQIPTAEIGRSVGRLQLLPCDHQAYSPQLFVHGEFGSLRTDESLCVDFQSADRPRPGSILALLPCSDHDRQRWILSDGQLQHFRSRLCVRGRAAHLELVICSDHSDTTRVYGEPARWWRWAVRFDQSNSSLESNLT